MNYMQLIKRFGLRIFKDICSSFHSFYIYSAPHCFACGMQSTKVWLSFVEWMGHHTVKFVFFFFPPMAESSSLTPWTAACQASLSITNSQSLLKLMSESVMPSNLCCPLLLPPSICPSIRVFSNESVLWSGGQSIGASALVLPMNIQGWFPLHVHRVGDAI